MQEGGSWKSHELVHQSWGECSMGPVIDLLYGACDPIKLNENYSWTMNTLEVAHGKKTITPFKWEQGTVSACIMLNII